jgi:hypothetical protein
VRTTLLLVALALSACTNQQVTVTGRVVDARGRPARSGIVRAYWSHPIPSRDQNAFVDRIAIEHHSLDSEGRFSFTAPTKPDRFEAESSDVKHYGTNATSVSDNVIVVR